MKSYIEQRRESIKAQKEVFHESVVGCNLYLSLVKCCFFCGQAADTDIYEVTTFQVDRHVRKSAEFIGDSVKMWRST